MKLELVYDPLKKTVYIKSKENASRPVCSLEFSPSEALQIAQTLEFLIRSDTIDYPGKIEHVRRAVFEK